MPLYLKPVRGVCKFCQQLALECTGVDTQIQPMTGSCMEARPKGQRLKIWRVRHKCRAATLCNNRCDNRERSNFLLFSERSNYKENMGHKDETWRQKKFASNTALYFCSENFVETDYRKCLTVARRDLVKNTVPSIFTWSDRNDEVNERS